MLIYNQLRLFYGRDDVTRTRDPYVPNVVRYQLRYIPLPSFRWGLAAAKVRKSWELGVRSWKFFSKKVRKVSRK